MDVKLIPPNSIVLHIGQPKTGTTYLQYLIEKKCDDLLENYNVYLPKRIEDHRNYRNTTREFLHLEDKSPRWQVLTNDILNHPTSTVFLSSELLSRANETQIVKLKELFGNKLNIMITIRHLGELLPSSWAQYIKSGGVVAYEQWLKDILINDQSVSQENNQYFIERFDQSAFITKWANIIGKDKVYLVITDKKNVDFITNSFETLFSLPTNYFLDNTDIPNIIHRTPSWEYLEFTRLFNEQIEGEISEPIYRSLVKSGGFSKAFGQTTQGTKILLPQWAADIANQRSARYATEIAQIGINILGNIYKLAEQVPYLTQPLPEVPNLPLSDVISFSAVLFKKAMNKIKKINKNKLIVE